MKHNSAGLMPLAVAEKIIGGLSRTSKMPWYSWSISAKKCKTGSKLRRTKGSVCASCYALKGMYRFQNVQDAHKRRFEAWKHPLFEDAFVAVLTHKFHNQRGNENRFRWFDSGDIQSVEMLETIVNIVIRTPFLRHWLPTHEPTIVAEYRKKHGDFPHNLVVRISHPMVGQTFKRRPQGLPVSTVGVDTTCIAYTQNGECRDCDRCWTSADVDYPIH